MDENREIVINQSIFRIGCVLSVDGRSVKIRVDKQKNLSHIIYNGTLVKNISVGGYVKIIKGFSCIIAKVESEYIKEDYIQNDNNYSSHSDKIFRVLNVSLLGYLEPNRFVKGVRELPLIDNECFLLTNDEFRQIHRFVKNDSDATIKIGCLSDDNFVPISLGVNKLFSSHIGVFGNTGSGKSYTLSKLYRALFVKYAISENFKNNSKFLFFDFNGEYSGEKVIVDDKKVYNVSTRNPVVKIPLSSSLLDLDVLCIFANATEKTQRPFINRCIKYKKYIQNTEHFKNILRKNIIDILSMSDKQKSTLLIDYVLKILPKAYKDKQELVELSLTSDFTFHNVKSYYFTSGDYSKSFQSNKSLIEDTSLYKQVDLFKFSENEIVNFISVMYLQLISDLLGNRAMNEHISPAINKLKSAADDIYKVIDFTKNANFWDDKNIAVINLNDVNLDMKRMIPLLISHQLYKEHKKLKEDNPSYLNIIIDEAHNILSYSSNRESDTWKDYRLEVFEEIIKEGRKFGVFMTIASQRPSDISTTIISQLHNYFIHRLVNDEDLDKVGRSISYLDRVSKESLPILATGVCVIAGQLTEMPIMVKIDEIEPEFIPHNETIDVVKKWE